jgi:hypothetical protein
VYGKRIARRSRREITDLVIDDRYGMRFDGRGPRTRPRLGNIPVMRLNTHFRSNVIAGVIAFVIYLVIALATGTSFGSALLVAVILGLATFAISYIISSLIVAARRR